MRKIFFLCDGEVPTCKKNTCYKRAGEKNSCHHTSDITHAINFRKISNHKDGSYFENDQSRRNMTGQETI